MYLKIVNSCCKLIVECVLKCQVTVVKRLTQTYNLVNPTKLHHTLLTIGSRIKRFRQVTQCYQCKSVPSIYFVRVLHSLQTTYDLFIQKISV